MRAPLLVAVLVLAAGCVAEPAQPTAVPGAPVPRPETLAGTHGVLAQEAGTGEPSFGVTPDGTLFANHRGGRGGAVYRSTDDGATWERIATPVEPMPNFDPDLAVDKDGTIWFSALWIGCTSVASSRDGGETWLFNPAACNAPVSDRQYVIPTQGGTAYLYSHQLPTFWQMAAKTTDYGRTWIPTGLVEPPTNNLLTGSSGWGGGGFWNEATGSVFFTWSWSDPSGASAAGFAVTRDEGASFEVGALPWQGGVRLGLGLVVGAADDAGNVYLAWGEGQGEDDGVAIYLAASADDGRTWNDPVRVDTTTGSKVFPAITAGAPGAVAIAYYESDDPAYPSDVEGTWNVTLSWTRDALSPAPTFEHGTLSPRPVKEGGICIDGTTCRGDREFADYFQIHVLPDGRVGAIYNSLLEIADTTVEVYAATRDAILA